MNFFVTREQMQALDRAAIQKRGIPSLSLMENAGRGVVERIRLEFPLRDAPTAAIFCGKGNNGGDGLVIARRLHEAGYRVKTFLLAPEEEYRGDALVNLHRLGLPILLLSREKELSLYGDEIRGVSFLVDAIFGTGLDRPVQGFTARLIRFLNEIRKPVVAVDIPSGLCANTGKILGEAVRATLTVTLHRPKEGLVFGPDSDLAGNIRVVSIGIPEDLDEKIPRKEFLIGPDLFRDCFRPRARSSHKNTYGHALTVAGSRRKPGAAWMSARAALRAGAGLSTLALPECAYRKIDFKFSEVMFEPQPDDGDFFSPESLNPLLKLAKSRSALACGPGLGVSEGLAEWVKGLIEGIKIPCVLDADALNNLSGNLKTLRGKHPPLILTPHPGEMARLVGDAREAPEKKRKKIVLEFAKKYKVHLVLKGYRTWVATPVGRLFVNSTGNPGMATAGAGDVLTGILVGLLAQGMPVEKAVLAGVWIHGRAGDLAARRHGEAGTVAWDIAEKVPEVLRELVEGEDGIA
ncbi:MAG: NAD(P)H-hydrate dehydratase [bacterium]